MRAKWIVGLGAGLVAAALAAGCTGGAGAGGTAGPEATDTAEPGPAIITGTAACGEDPSPPVTVQEEVAYGVCERTMSDPRLSGTWHFISRTGGTEAVTAVWAEGTLENDGGSWGCKQFGVGSMEANETGAMDEVCVGRGAYAGLTAYVHSITADMLGTFGILAWIEGTAARR